MAIDSAGNVYLAGQTYGSLGGTYQGGSDAWVAKYTADGHLVWTRQLGTPGSDAATGVATDAAGDVCLTGPTSGSLGGANKGDYDAWVAKYGADGSLVWTQQFGSKEADLPTGVATDADGDVYLTGYAGTAAHRDGWSAWVAKYAVDGRRIWKRQPGSEHNDWATALATDASGNAYVTGYTWGSFGGANKGDADAWLLKLSKTTQPTDWFND